MTAATPTRESRSAAGWAVAVAVTAMWVVRPHAAAVAEAHLSPILMVPHSFGSTFAEAARSRVRRRATGPLGLRHDLFTDDMIASRGVVEVGP